MRLNTPWEFVFPGHYAAIRFMEGQNKDLEYWKRLGKYAMNIHSLLGSHLTHYGDK